MRLCTKCNRLLKNSDKYCPYCAGEMTAGSDTAASASAGLPPKDITAVLPPITAAPAAAQPQYPYAAAPPVSQPQHPYSAMPTHAQPFAMPVTSTPVPVVSPTDPTKEFSAFPTAQKPAPSAASQPNSLVGDFPSSIAVATFPSDEEDLLPEFGEEEPDRPGLIEQAVEDMDPDNRPRGVSKLTITLITGLIILGLGLGFAIFRQIRNTENVVTNETFTQLIKGAWLSEPFVFSASDTQQYVELLTINEDGTFKLQYFIPDRTSPNGYKDGTWEVYQEASGVYEVHPAYNIILLVYSDKSGTQVNYTRELVKIDGSSMSLREYYDKERTDYFDVSFNRV